MIGGAGLSGAAVFLVGEGIVGTRVGASDTTHGVIAAVAREGRWLMIQRSDTVIAPRAWCFPGGGVEPGESQEEALVREVWEELGLTVAAGRCVWTWQRPDGRLNLSWWTAGIVSGEIRPEPAEVRDFRWMTPAEIRATDGVLPNNIAFLDHVALTGLRL